MPVRLGIFILIVINFIHANMTLKSKIKNKSRRLSPALLQEKKIGAPPGTLLHVGEQHLDEIQIVIYDYDKEHFDEINISEIKEAKSFLENPSKTWIKICGLHDIEKLQSIWSFFDLHPLIQEDIVNTTQRPKVEEYENNIFFVLRMLSFTEQDKQLESEQISIVLGENYLLSFQEKDHNYFAPVIKRLQSTHSRLRKHGPDYLAYALIDTVVDYYFKMLQILGEQIEIVEEELMEDPDRETFRKIHSLRREIIFFRKTVWPLRDTVNSTIRDESPFISENTNIFLRDVYDHIVQTIDGVENFREMVMGMHDMYMSQISNKMNEVMKVLTIIATIFIPLTFIAGIYGMNFNPSASPYNMPELEWYWGYPAVMAIMFVIAIIMLVFFRKKEWL